MNFSSLTALDIAVLVVLAISLIAVITVIFLLMSVNKKLYTEADLNRDATVRFKATRNSASAIIVDESRRNTHFGIISFVNGKTDDQMKDIDADIVVNGTPAAVSFTGLSKATNGTLKILNNTDADLTIANLTFFPGNTIGQSSFTVDTLMNTVFRHDLLVKGKITVCDFAIKMANPKEGQMNVDLTLSRNKTIALET
uniref:Wsv311-like protein n=1 Tax=Metopaulias depressus WSSV-like virus TaxID=1675544 RepID=A0A0K0VL94_9VIRU|nr:wsv311-like protein [Metopaulias depressus WSSV-like virus]